MLEKLAYELPPPIDITPTRDSGIQNLTNEEKQYDYFNNSFSPSYYSLSIPFIDYVYRTFVFDLYFIYQSF
jgi:hypothetical protein